MGCDQGRWRKIRTPEETRPLRTEQGLKVGFTCALGLPLRSAVHKAHSALGGDGAWAEVLEGEAAA